MKATCLDLEGLILIELVIHEDPRGFFTERFHQNVFREKGLPTNFVQINHSRSALGVLRGLHYQYEDPQGKLVGVTRGKIWDVALDIRPKSSTYGQSFGLDLSDMNGRMLWVPPGFAHGFCVIGEEPADILYQVDAPYNPAGEGGIFWADPDLSVSWPLNHPIVSARDEGLPSFADYRAHPVRWNV